MLLSVDFHVSDKVLQHRHFILNSFLQSLHRFLSLFGLLLNHRLQLITFPINQLDDLPLMVLPRLRLLHKKLLYLLSHSLHLILSQLLHLQLELLVLLYFLMDRLNLVADLLELPVENITSVGDPLLDL